MFDESEKYEDHLDWGRTNVEAFRPKQIVTGDRVAAAASDECSVWVMHLMGEKMSGQEPAPEPLKPT